MLSKSALGKSLIFFIENIYPTTRWQWYLSNAYNILKNIVLVLNFLSSSLFGISFLRTNFDNFTILIDYTYPAGKHSPDICSGTSFFMPSNEKLRCALKGLVICTTCLLFVFLSWMADLGGIILCVSKHFNFLYSKERRLQPKVSNFAFSFVLKVKF